MWCRMLSERSMVDPDMSSSTEDSMDSPSPLFHNVEDLEYSKQFMERLTRLRSEDQQTDVVLKAGERSFPCHRVVLSAASEYFNGMFNSGLEETSSGVIEIRGTDSETLSSLLQYIYSANIKITTDNVQNLVQASDQFQFSGLKKACEDFMLQQIAPSNCIGFYKFSKLYPLKRLREGARATMLKKFPEVVRSTEFSELSMDDVIEYISDTDLRVDTEDTVFEAVCMWVKDNTEEREASFPQVAAHVRLPFCTGIYLCRVVAPCTLMSRSTECQSYLEEARAFHMLPDHRHEICTPRTVPRCKFAVYNCLVIVGGLTKEDHENRYSWYLKSDASSWELLAQLPRPAWKFYSVSATQSGILVSGGYYHEVKRDCWLFDMSEKKWKSLPPMIEGRCKHGSVVHNGNVYVLGGEDDFRLLTSMERYNSRQRQWSLLPALSKGLSDPLTATHGQYIYVLSGIEGSDATSTNTFAYDTVWGVWQSRAEMPEPIRLGAVATVNEKIYVVGGYTKSCMSYDPKLDCWTVLTAPREKHGNAPATVWRGKILLGGGDVDSNETTSVVEEYDPTEDSWSYWAVTLKEELSCHHLLNIDLYGIE